MRKQYRIKHDIFLNALKPFEQRFTISGSNAGLHLLLTDMQDGKEEELAALAKSVGVKVYAMDGFRMEKPKAEKMPATIILGYGALTTEEIRQGTEALKKVRL
jgi:GntR family transcriptional regulator/MocR family aminotransferase